MSFVLSVVRPPEEGAAFGKATVSDLLTSRETAVNLVAHVLKDSGMTHQEIRSFFQRKVWQKEWSQEITHEGTGIQFRLDDMQFVPNVCPCCGRLVKHGDHALAGSEDAYCLGCFTWKRGVPQCLPENTAHTEEPS